MNRAIALLLLLASLALNLAWLSQDRLLRDGDEEGHVGAAELFLDDLRSDRLIGAARRALVEDMGDYPSLYPALVGGWWWAAGGGDPGRVGVRQVNLLFLLAAALAVWRVARWEVGPGAAALGGAAVLYVPFSAGLARHFMPEGALTAAVAMAICAAAWQRRRPTAWRALALGLALGAGMLTKQTFPLYAAIPVALTARWRPSLALAAAGAAVAAPWYAANVIEQLSYGGDSAAYKGQAGWLAHLLFYPRALAGLALGPAWVALAATGAWLGWRRARPLVGLGAAWLVGGVLLLALIPKKYDRLLAPLLPAAGLFVAAGVSARPRLGPAVAAGAAWTAALSLTPTRWIHPPEPVIDFEPGCIQTWLRPPEPRGPGFEAVAAAAAERPYGPVRVIAPPPIPCALQTTFGWEYHLGPWLRRAGHERPVVIAGAEGDAPDAPITVDFRPGAEGDLHEVPLLGVGYAIR